MTNNTPGLVGWSPVGVRLTLFGLAQAHHPNIAANGPSATASDGARSQGPGTWPAWTVS